ncbi:MAG TPA: tetratricopeptide repeat protein [Candidatus Odoribacter faecigallinarum]|jgi:tetratricopeptide (TPR) repeat protein|uniref:Tetratricopeptide repeat protein n=1 Tax=Candidatus Odoribacter faecigallinarum TaxID=2838706 RepID=A0A9D1V0X9_9BACT|nr:tetratricopeptide repeat protein [Candidatus Odoribacter faecigallinarum]
MRKLSIILVMLFCATMTYAQKGKVTQASSYFTSGKLDQAKKVIDEAIQHEACVNFDKAYFVKGQIYQAICESQNADYKKLDPNAVDVAWEAFQKVIELDVKGKYTKRLATQYSNLVIDFTNRAIEYYNNDQFAEALAAFKRVLEIENSPILTADAPAKIDTAVIFNAAMTAQKAEQWADAEKYYKEVLKYDYNAAQAYAMLSIVLREEGKEEEALEYLHKGYELYPDNSYMLVELINHYLLGGEPEKAEVYLDAAIKQDPNNASFYRAKGTLYEKLEQPAKAEEMYRKALELDPKDFLAQYNLGNIKLSEVIEFHKKVQDIVDIDEYNKEMEKVFDGYASVIPYFERALELNPTEKNTISTLKELYFKLRDRDPKYQALYEEMEAKLGQATEQATE